MVSLRDLYLKNGYGLSRKLTVDCQVISVWVNYMNHRDLEVQPRLCLITSHSRNPELSRGVAISLIVGIPSNEVRFNYFGNRA
jgi:hypothetical protein